jgi:glycerol uptake facilitator protein
VPAYVGAQVVGAIVGAAAIIGVLGQKASDVGLGVASYNTDTVGVAQAFTAEFVGTFILVFTIFGVIHRKAAAGFAGVAIGLVVFAAIIPVAPTTGASINPARTFGPMLVQQVAGGDVKWGQLPVYLAAELLAGVAAALLFGLLSRTPADRLTAGGPDLGAPETEPVAAHQNSIA